MKLLTAGDVLEIIKPLGITARTFRYWHDKGWVIPAEGGDGHGDHRKYTPLQVVGLVCGIRVFQSELGCSPSYIGRCAAVFGDLRESTLLRWFKEGRSHLAVVYGDEVFLQGPMPYWTANVKGVYGEVMSKIREIEARYEGAPFGRPRGLAGKGAE